MDHINEEDLFDQLRESIAALAEQEGMELSEEQLDELAESALDDHYLNLELDEHFEAVLGEEYTQLDELDKKTLKSYVKKAGTSRDRHWAKAEKEEDKAMSTNGEKYPEKQRRHMDAANASIKTWVKRGKGIEAAKKKLSEEDIDQYLQDILGEEYGELTEISKKTIGSYIKQASADRTYHSAMSAKKSEWAHHAKGLGDTLNSDHESKKAAEHQKKSDKRRDGIQRAVDKLTKEDIEAHLLDVLGEEAYGQLDELSKKSLANYVSAAAEDGRGHEFEAGHAAAKRDYAAQDKSQAKARKRQRGIDKAVRKLTKESLEQILAFAAEGKTVELSDVFATAMNEHLLDRLDEARAAMAQKLFHDVSAGE